jgi:hypothetical protein
VLMLGVTLGWATENAHADADPASDVLYTVDVFLSYQAPEESPVGRELAALTAEAKRARFPIKVAVVVQPSDLGGIPQLFGHPKQYALFLGRELLSYGYAGTLVVAMPAGFGVFGPGATAKAKRALTKLSRPQGSDTRAVGRAAALAVRAIAAAAGHRLATPAGDGKGGGGFVGTPIYIAAGITLAVVVASQLGVLVWRRGRRRRP